MYNTKKVRTCLLLRPAIPSLLLARAASTLQEPGLPKQLRTDNRDRNFLWAIGSECSPHPSVSNTTDRRLGSPTRTLPPIPMLDRGGSPSLSLCRSLSLSSLCAPRQSHALSVLAGWLVYSLQGASFIIDFHNFGYSLLALKTCRPFWCLRIPFA